MRTFDAIPQTSSIRPLGPVAVASRIPLQIADGAHVLLSGTSPTITHLRAQIRRVAPYFRTGSLTGEPGCADEQVARMMHEHCPLHDKEFVVLPATEAERRFAGPAVSVGANEGVIYLPEADRLSKAAQAGLLRMLRERNARSARVLAFTGHGLRPLISAGFFSVELAAALGALRIALPTLSERRQDIPILVQHLLRTEANLASLSPPHVSDEFLSAAAAFGWSGNLHQMRATMNWLLSNRQGTVLRAKDLQAASEAMKPSRATLINPVRMVPLEQVAQEHIRAVLMACKGNKLRAAEVLGISRSTLYRMLDCGGFETAQDDSGEESNRLALAG